MTLRRDICVLGAGPAGLFASSWLRHRRRVRTTVIGTPVFGMLRHDYSPTGPFSLVPILPPNGSHFPPSARGAGILRTAYVGQCHRARSADHQVGSFAHYSAANLGERSLVLARKQFGPMAHTEPMLEVRDKIERNYSAGMPPMKRAGYIGGESPYVATMRAAASAAEIVDQAVESIDYRDRSVRFANGTRLYYGAIILTVPLPRIARLLGVPPPRLASAPAEFVVAHCPTATENLLIYDCEPGSPVFRMVSPRAGLLVVQLALIGHRSEALSDLAMRRLRERIGGILGSAEVELDCRIRRIESAYPTDPPDAGFMDDLLPVLRRGNVVRLGRFAEWRYVDLHELNWTWKLGNLCG
jgi:hypothetical protein